MSSPPMIIVGAGHAALRAVLSMRQAGFDGGITLIAKEGLPAPVERPPLSKWASNAQVPLKPIVPQETFDGCDVTCLEAEVTRLHPDTRQVELSDGQMLTYSKLLLATGADARRLPVSLTLGADVHYLRNAADAATLHKAAQDATSALVIGGGFIGLELAASLRRSGLAVHLCEGAGRLLERAVSAPVAAVVQQLHADNGVTFTFDAQIIRIEGTTAHLADGTTHTADLIVAGIGSAPTTELAAQAGLAVDNGIIVDDQMQTSVADVFAAGDCVCFPLYGPGGAPTRLEAWQAAGDQGDLAGHNMAADTARSYTAVPWFWSEQYDHVLQVAGLPSPALSSSERRYGADHCVSFGQNPDGALAYVCGIAPGAKVAKDVRFASKLIAGRKEISAEALADNTVSLKSLLA